MRRLFGSAFEVTMTPTRSPLDLREPFYVMETTKGPVLQVPHGLAPWETRPMNGCFMSLTQVVFMSKHANSAAFHHRKTSKKVGKQMRFSGSSALKSESSSRTGYGSRPPYWVFLLWDPPSIAAPAASLQAHSRTWSCHTPSGCAASSYWWPISP